MSRSLLSRAALAPAIALLLPACGAEPERAGWSDLSAVPAVEASGSPVRLRSALHADLPGDTLRLARWFGDSTAFGRITFARRAGGLLLLGDVLTSPHLSLVELASGEVVRRFGRDGDGPREFRQPRWSYADPDDPSRLWVYDFGHGRFSLLDLDAAGEDLFAEERTIHRPGPLIHPVWLADSIVSNGLFADAALLFTDRTGKPSRRVVAPLPGGDLPSAEGRTKLSQNQLAPHPSLDRLALAYQYESRVDVLSARGALLASVRGPREITLRHGFASDRKGRSRFRLEEGSELAYVAADASRRYVYALFCGDCRARESLPTLLHVFRWNGEFVGEIALDRPIRTFSIAPDESALYGVVDEPYPLVGEWPLPEWLRREPRIGGRQR